MFHHDGSTPSIPSLSKERGSLGSLQRWACSSTVGKYIPIQSNLASAYAL